MTTIKELEQRVEKMDEKIEQNTLTINTVQIYQKAHKESLDDIKKWLKSLLVVFIVFSLGLIGALLRNTMVVQEVQKQQVNNAEKR